MYINILHLLWIVPLSVTLGIFAIELVSANKEGDE